jgi:hypothetical protein
MFKRCQYCGMIATKDPDFHEERYGHKPVIIRDGKSYIWISDKGWVEE